MNNDVSTPLTDTQTDDTGGDADGNGNQGPDYHRDISRGISSGALAAAGTFVFLLGAVGMGVLYPGGDMEALAETMTLPLAGWSSAGVGVVTATWSTARGIAATRRGTQEGADQ